MRATSLKLHNFRSFKDAEIELAPCGLLVGPNGAGKSNVLAAIRVFYDDIKFSKDRDLPRMPRDDEESWVEMEFEPTEDEAAALREGYLDSATNSFRVRRYMQTTTKDAEGKSCEGGVFGYEGGKLSDSRFYGAKNVQAAKLGQVLYIPAVSKLDEQMKLSGPSPLRELVNRILRGGLEESQEFSDLTGAFSTFSGSLKGAETSPLSALEAEITSELGDWGHRFSIDIRSLSLDELLKSLVEARIVDGDLGEEMEPGQFGHGFQRHLVYSLMVLAARQGRAVKMGKPKKGKKEFDPALFWVLYEEPEAFLHPPQADVLSAGLRQFAAVGGQQVLITTHSVHFASRSLEDIPALVRLSREGKETKVGQVVRNRLDATLRANHSVVPALQAAGVAVADADTKVEMEAIKYALWLNPLRTTALFSQNVLLVEGPTERALIDYLLSRDELKAPTGGIAVIDTLGKWNMHRFMNLLGALRIPHCVLYDKDERPHKDPKHKQRSEILNQAIEDSRTAFTKHVVAFEDDLEAFLGIEEAQRPHQKPQHVLYQVDSGSVAQEKMKAFCDLVGPLLSAS